MPIVVNGELVSDAAVRYELDRLVKFYSQHMAPDEIAKQMELLQTRARDQAIGAKLLLDHAAEMDIRVPEEDVDERLEALVERAGGRTAFNASLVQQERTESEVRTAIERGCRVESLIERISGGVPDPTEDEIKAHFDAHMEEYRRPRRALARHLLIRPASSGDADRETARARLVAIRREIDEEDADFGEMAAQHSECPSGKEGGSLGWVSRGMLLPEFEEAVFSIDVDEMSEVFESPVGFHIVYKHDEEEGGPASLDEARETIRDFLRHVRRGEAVKAYVDDLRRKAAVEVTD